MSSAVVNASVSTNSSSFFNKKIIIAGITTISLGGIIYYLVSPHRKNKKLKKYIEYHNLNENCNDYLDIFQSQAISPIVRCILRHLLISEANVNNETYLPIFNDQTNYLIQQIKESYTNGKLLLFEGSQGNGKGYALRTWAKKKNRTYVYLSLKNCFRRVSNSQNRTLYIPNHISNSSATTTATNNTPSTTILNNNTNYQENNLNPDYSTNTETNMNTESSKQDEDITSSVETISMEYSQNLQNSILSDIPERSLFIFGLLEAFGFFSLDTFSEKRNKKENDNLFQNIIDNKRYLNPRMLSEALQKIETALHYICLRDNNGPVILILDDIQLLFTNQDNSQYDSLLEILQWLLKCQKEGLMDVLFCSSEKSVITSVKKLKGFEKYLVTKVSEDVDTSKIKKYLLNDVNKILKENNKFTKETAEEFAKYFSANFEEIENFCKSEMPVKKYIALRREDYRKHVQNFFEVTPGFELYPSFVDPYSTPPKEILKDCILELMMNCILSLDNILPGRNGDARKWAFVQNMIDHNLLKWIPMKKKTSQHKSATSYNFIPSMDTSLLGDCGDENPTSYWQTLSSNNWREDVVVQSEQYPLDLDLTFYNPFIREILEQWFNQEL